MYLGCTVTSQHFPAPLTGWFTRVELLKMQNMTDIQEANN